MEINYIPISWWIAEAWMFLVLFLFYRGTVLNIRDTCDMKAAENRYFKELSCLRKSGEVYWKGWYINVAELRPKPDYKTDFQRLMNHLGRTNQMAVLKPENDVILLLVPNCSLTHDLGKFWYYSSWTCNWKANYVAFKTNHSYWKDLFRSQIT